LFQPDADEQVKIMILERKLAGNIGQDTRVFLGADIIYKKDRPLGLPLST
jgi:hypothetical protein